MRFKNLDTSSRCFYELKDLCSDGLAMYAECLRKDSPKQALLAKGNERRPVRRFRSRWTNYIEDLGWNRVGLHPSEMMDVMKQGCKSLLSIGGVICNITPILPYFQHWGNEPRPRFFSGKQIKWRAKKKKGLHLKCNTFSPEFSWRHKKKVFTKNGTLVFPEFEWRPALRCTPESNFLGECRCRPYSNYWGGCSQIIGGYIPPPPPPPPGFGTPGWKTVKYGGLISSCCPRNPHGKAGNEKRKAGLNCVVK